MVREMMKGNEAVAEAAIRAGVAAYFGYPITPQTELLEYMAKRMPELGRAFVQAEARLVNDIGIEGVGGQERKIERAVIH